MSFNLTEERTYVKINSFKLTLMTKILTATQFRAQLYSTLDEILQTGRPIWIKKSGKKFKLSLEKTKIKDKFSRLETHRTIIGNPDDLIDIKLGEWTELKNL